LQMGLIINLINGLINNFKMKKKKKLASTQ